MISIKEKLKTYSYYIMYIKRTKLKELYDKKMLNSMDIGIELSILSYKVNDLSIDEEINNIECFLNEMHLNDNVINDFIEEVYEYYIK